MQNPHVSTNEPFTDPINHASDAAASIADATTGAVKGVTTAAKGIIDDAQVAVGDLIQGAKERGGKMVDDASARAKSLQQDGEAYVRENPLKAVLFAVGAGFALALSLRR